ncbi:hypothetical protein VNO77_06676 [Canavalia gladiata]|uniref:NAC domain-containing protein n=1 Tax=Canavalia gladiata TaxID=3824 RepID=A0AAN9M7P8_CANGL
MDSSPPLLPKGFRFHPYDDELVSHYLKHMLLGTDSSIHNVMPLIDVCNFEPWDLPAFSKIKSDDHQWFFFSPLGLKFTNDTRNRCNRKTKAGYWKPTGKDRSVKTRGTNNVIGTKKTLVFYMGRSSHGIKTNWVIHEYHAVTIPHDKRGFVLCRLIEKAEKNPERRVDTWRHDEGEPSSYIAADSENQATADRLQDVNTSPELNLESIFPTLSAEDYGFPSLQQPVIVTEQEPAFQGSTFPNAYFGKENNIPQISFETTEEDNNLDYIKMFLNENVAGEDAFVGEETIPASAYDSIPSQSWKSVDYESLKTYAEPFSAQQGNILGTSSSVCNEHNDSRGRPPMPMPMPMPMVRSLHDAVHASPPPVSSRDERNLEKKDGTSDDFWGLDAFDDLTPLQRFHILSKYHTRSVNCLTLVTNDSQGHEKVSGQTASPPEAQKETVILQSKKQQRKALGASGGNNLETTRDQSPAVNGQGSSTNFETLLSAKVLQHDKIPCTTSVSNEHTDSRENLVMSTVKSPHNEANIEKEDSTSDDEILRPYAFSDSDAKQRLFIYMLKRASPSPSPLGRCQNEYHRRSCNFVSLRSASGKSQTKRNIFSQAVSQQEALKETHILVLNKVQRKVQGTSSRKKLETTSNLSPGVFGKGSFIHLETPLVQRSWSLFMWSCAWSCWHGSEFHHDMMHKVKLKGVS